MQAEQIRGSRRQVTGACCLYRKGQQGKEKEGGEEMIGYLARDRDRTLLLHYNCPVRDEYYGVWNSDGCVYLGFNQEIDDKEFSDIKWESEPVKIEITRKERNK